MERELWKVVYRALKKLARRFEQSYVQLHAWRIAAVLLWAALHDRPVRWACDKRNWSTTRLRPGRLPSEATMSRRAKKLSFALFLSAPADELKGAGPPAWELAVAGETLPGVWVGPESPCRWASAPRTATPGPTSTARGTSCTRSGAGSACRKRGK